MILVIGTQNCSKCSMTKAILDKKNIEYEYKLSDEIPEVEFNTYMGKAKTKGLMNFPLIVRDEEIIVLEDVIE